MKFIPGPETREAVFKHPFVLAGLAVVALLGLTAAVLVIIDSARDDADAGQQVGIEPRETQTAGPIAKTAVARGVVGRTNTTTAVRRAPGQLVVLGTIPRNTDVTIDGRSEEGNWLRIIFPPNSELHGWVSVDSVDVTGDVESLAVTTPEPVVVVDLPTTDPELALTPVDTPPPEETEDPEATETPDPGLPDLVVGTTPVLSGGLLFITVVNQGSGIAEGDFVVAIFNVDGSELLGGATLNGFSLGAGLSIDVGTGYEVTNNQTLLLIVDPNGEIEESDNTNNQITVSVSVGAAEEPPPEEDAPVE
jgi:CARDB protein